MSHSVSFCIVSITNELMKGASSQVLNIEQLWFVTLALSKDIFFQFFELAFVGDTVCSSYLETVVRLSFSWLCSPVSCQTDNSSPLWGALGSLWLLRVPLAQQAELAPQPAKLNPPCLSVQTAVMFPFDLLSHWNRRWYFAELFWNWWGIMCFWYEKGEHRFLLQVLFTGD